MKLQGVPFNRPHIIGKELYYIAQAVFNGHISGDGYFTTLCHQWIEETFETSKALLTHSCTASLELAALLCDLSPGDEVILPSYTFTSTGTAFALRGATLVFVDIRPDTLNIDEKLIEQAITPRTKAIVPVHYAGVPCEMDKIMELADKYDLLVIEDAAQAFLSTYKGKQLGTIGQLGCFSFHETKNIISGEGGALLINDPVFIERAEILREKGTNRAQFFRGQVDKYTWQDIGSSFLPSDMIAAFLWGQLEHAHSIIENRSASFSQYYQLLRPIAERFGFRLPYVDEDSTVNGHIFFVITRDSDEQTDLIEYLSKKQITALFHYQPLHSAPAGETYGRASDSLTITDDFANRVVRLPLYYGITSSDIELVTSEIESFYIEKKKRASLHNCSAA